MNLTYLNCLLRAFFYTRAAGFAEDLQQDRSPVSTHQRTKAAHIRAAHAAGACRHINKRFFRGIDRGTLYEGSFVYYVQIRGIDVSICQCDVQGSRQECSNGSGDARFTCAAFVAKN